MKALVIGFPKSGTSTLYKAFLSSGFRSAHWRIGDEFVGEMMYAGHFQHDDPFHFLSSYDCIAQADVCLPDRGKNYWPNLDIPLLLRIRKKYPSCLFVMNVRPVEKTIDSMTHWNDMRARLIRSDIVGLPAGCGARDDELAKWITGHYDLCRALFRNDPNFLELNIESTEAPGRLGEALHHDIRWWGNANSRQALAVSRTA